jgi:hypothetical protein
MLSYSLIQLNTGVTRKILVKASDVKLQRTCPVAEVTDGRADITSTQGSLLLAL